MRYKNSGDNPKKKPRGKPFPKGNLKGKIKNEILDDTRLESGIDGGIVENLPENAPSALELNIDPIEIAQPANEINNEPIKEILEQKDDSNQVTKKPTEIVESLDFMHGTNKLSIRMTKQHNRMFRVQIFLNDGDEIRPMTYTGSNTAMSFWNLLKGALKK